MPIEYRTWISRRDARENLDVLFVFGDNFAQSGLGGQAKELRGEPNAVGIPTKRSPTWAEDAFLTDADLEEWRAKAAPAFDRIKAHSQSGGLVVWPMSGIGTGLAELPKRAPAIMEAIRNWMCEIDPDLASAERPARDKRFEPAK
jgi:hypothetical protein